MTQRITPSDLDARYAFGREVVREAGALALNYFINRDQLAIEEKGVQDLVSRADREVEELIRKRVAETFGDDPVVGEEEGGDYAEQFWIVDPIDGTTNFLRGLPYWGIALAFAQGSKAVLAFTYDPVHDALFCAREGQGATRNDQPIRVTERGVNQSCIALAHSPKAAIDNYVATLNRLAERQIEHRRLGSIAISLSIMAQGGLDGVITSSTNSWDVLGGLLIAQEAGASVSLFENPEELGRRRPIAAATQPLAAIVQDLAGVKLMPAAGHSPTP